MTWRAAVRLGRVSNLPTVWTNVLAAAVLAGAMTPVGALAVVALACSLFYVGGMFLNDAFDREIDARLRPERPIPAGDATASVVLVVGFALLGSGLMLVAATAWVVGHGGTGVAVTSASTLAGTIVLYDLWHKQNPLAPLLMGLCRVLVYVTAAAALTGTVSWPVLAGSFALLAYLIGLTYVARQETLGEIRNLWPLAFLAAPFAVALPSATDGAMAGALFVGFLVWVLRSLAHLGWRAHVDVPRAVVSLIAGIALLDGMLLAGAGATSLAGVAVAAFALTLWWQRFVPGT